MINYDDLAFLVFVVVELGNELISLDMSSWEVQCLSNVILLVFIRLPEIDKKEICL